MLTLAFDVLSPFLSLAILQDEEVLFKKAIKEKSRHSELLVCEIENLLNKVGVWYQDLNLIATTITPGSFTSSRIALVTAKTLKLSLNVDLALLDATQVLAFKNLKTDQKNIFVIMDGFLGEYYVAGYLVEENKMQILQKTQICKLEEVSSVINKYSSSILVCGNAKKALINAKLDTNCQILCNGYDQIDAVDIAKYAILQTKMSQNSQSLEMSYLRKPKIEKRKK